jgi:hypothetical protein
VTKSVRVYPVPGVYLNGVPHVEHDCDDKLCVESGAFTTKRPSTKAEPTEGPADAESPDSEE